MKNMAGLIVNKTQLIHIILKKVLIIMEEKGYESLEDFRGKLKYIEG